jgi:hypothetical protein
MHHQVSVSRNVLQEYSLPPYKVPCKNNPPVTSVLLPAASMYR